MVVVGATLVHGTCETVVVVVGATDLVVVVVVVATLVHGTCETVVVDDELGAITPAETPAAKTNAAFILIEWTNSR